MNSQKNIANEFLSALSKKQRGKIRDYYRLITSPESCKKGFIDSISEIWIQAEGDPKLLFWLEFIDFMLLNQDDDSLDDKRAYLSEYLGREIDLADEADQVLDKEWINKMLETISSEQDLTLLLKCPDGKNHVFVSLKGRSSLCEGNCFSEHLCEHCHLRLCDHKVVHIKETVAI